MKRTSRLHFLVRLIAPAAIVALALTPTGAFAKTQFQGGPLTNLNPAGDKIHVVLSSFPAKGGLYILECLNTVVASQTASQCDPASQIWVSPSTGATFAPTGMDIVIPVVGTVAGTECGNSKCSIFLTFDHTAAADRSEDQLISIAFAAGTSTSTKPNDLITASINGKPLSTTSPGTLAYRTPVAIKATSTSGATIAYASSTPNCIVNQGVITALKATGACDITVSTPATLGTLATTAHYPFLLAPGVQTIPALPSSLKVGTSAQLAKLSNFGMVITYSTSSKICLIQGNVLKALTKGSCTIVAKAAGEKSLWAALSLTRSLTVN